MRVLQSLIAVILFSFIAAGCGIGDEVREGFQFSLTIPAKNRPSGTVSFQEDFVFQTENAASANEVTIERVLLTTANQREGDLSFIDRFTLSLVQGQGLIELATVTAPGSMRSASFEPTFQDDVRRLIDSNNSVLLRASIDIDDTYEFPDEGLNLLILTEILIEK